MLLANFNIWLLWSLSILEAILPIYILHWWEVESIFSNVIAPSNYNQCFISSCTGILRHVSYAWCMFGLVQTLSHPFETPPYLKFWFSTMMVNCLDHCKYCYCFKPCCSIFQTFFCSASYFFIGYFHFYINIGLILKEILSIIFSSVLKFLKHFLQISANDLWSWFLWNHP